MSETAKIYVDIDSLLDTRQGILNILINDDEKVATYINTEKYNFREIDYFDDLVSMIDYDRLLKRRPKDILTKSTITYIINVINGKISNLEKRNTFYNEDKKPEIVVNIYPYDLTDTEEELIKNALFIKLDTNVFISSVNLPISEITPYYIKSNNFISCFIYDVSLWLNKNLESLKNIKLHDNLIYFPSIYKHNPGYEELKIITNLGFKDIFSYLEFLLSNSVKISFLPTLFYTNVITATTMLEHFSYTDLSKEYDTDIDLPDNFGENL